MTIDEAIKVLRQHNVTNMPVLKITRGQALEKDLLAQVLDSCEQLISEKAEYKRLLKEAVSIINNSFPEVGSCWGCANYDKVNDECKGDYFAECAEVCKWEHADEAFALIGEDGDANG